MVSFANVRDFCSYISGLVEKMGYECVECKASRSGKKSKLDISIDSPDGVSIKDCETVSRSLGEFLEERAAELEKFFPGSYQLEVGSAGIERPLFTIGHYTRFLKKDVEIVKTDKTKITGVISGTDPSQGLVTVETDGGGLLDVAFLDITRGRLLFRPDKGQKGGSKKPKKEKN